MPSMPLLSVCSALAALWAFAAADGRASCQQIGNACHRGQEVLASEAENEEEEGEQLSLLNSHQHRSRPMKRALSTVQDPAWIKQCYPHLAVQEQYSHVYAELQQCLGEDLSRLNVFRLGSSAFFCPNMRGNQALRRKECGWCESAPNAADQNCNYSSSVSCCPGVEGPCFKQVALANDEVVPGLYAEQMKMRYGDPLYVYPPESELSVANAPMNPFINVNQLYEDTSGHTLWGGQCPLSGDDETNLGKPPTVCDWLEFIRANQIKLLISLAPSHLERNQSAVKARCQDYIWEQKGMNYSAKMGTACGGQKYEVEQESQNNEWVWTAPGSAQEAKIQKRSVNFAGYKFEQLYFNAWPDAAGSHGADAPLPVPEAISTLINEAAQYQHVAVHCAGGRGRTGTVAVGTMALWQAQNLLTLDKAHRMRVGPGVTTASKLVDNVVLMRRRRADIIESTAQLMLLGQIFGLNSSNCALNVKVG